VWEGPDAIIWRVDSDILQRAVVYGAMPVAGMQLPLTRGSPSGRAIIDRQTIHVHDLAIELETEFPESKIRQPVTGTRTILATPMLREGIAIGAIVIRRTEVRPFTGKQIALLKTFADQAVIAIENVRLFNETKEALEQQTATGEILQVIASSPTDVQPVLDVVVENAARLCEAKDATIALVEGDVLQQVAIFGSIPVPTPTRVTRTTPPGRAIIDRKTIHVHDLAAKVETEFPDSKGRQAFTGTLPFDIPRSMPLLVFPKCWEKKCSGS